MLAALLAALREGATPSDVRARSPSALRIAHFSTGNDHSDWESPHHSHLERKFVTLYDSSNLFRGSACGECRCERPADHAVGAESAGAGVLREASSSSSSYPVAI